MAHEQSQHGGGQSQSGQAIHPQKGEHYRCAKCGVEMEVAQGCNCNSPCLHLNCCGQPMQKR